MKKVFYLIIVLFGSAATGRAQELTTRDGGSIITQAESLMKSYESALNAVVNSDFNAKEIESIISNSYALDNPNRIFLDGKVIIEDDTNPEKAAAGIAADLPVEKYMKELDLVYTKSEDLSVFLNNVSISDIKKKDNYYVKVYFDSLLGNKHKKINEPYKTVRRVAELKAENINGKWLTYIVGVRFFNKQDSINDISHSVKLMEPKDTGGDIVRELDNQNSIYLEYIRKGELAFASKEYEAAEEAFKQALLLRPNSHHPLRKIREIKALDWYAIHYAEANKAKQLRNYDAAIISYKKAREVKLTDAGIRSEIDNIVTELNNLVRNRDLFENSYNAGKYDELIKDYNKRLKNKGLTAYEEADLHLFLGRCYEAKNNTKDALKEYTEAVQKEGYYEQALMHRAALNTALALVASKSDDKAKHLQESHADLSVIISNNPKIAKNYILRASVREHLNEFKEATKDYEQAVKLEPTNAKLFLTKALYHLRQKNIEYEAAYACLNKAIDLEPTLADAYYRRGMVEYQFYKRLKEAADNFNAAKRHNLDESSKQQIDILSTNHYEAGIDLYRDKDFVKAIKKFEEASTIKPENYNAYFMKGEALYEMKNFAAAVKSYTDGLNYKKDLYVAIYKRGESYYNMKEFQQALSEYKKVAEAINFNDAVRSNPVAGALLIDSNIGVGKSCQALGNYADAISVNDATLKLVKESGKKIASSQPAAAAATYVSIIPFNTKSKLTELYNNTGRCRYKLKNYELAIKYLDKAIGYDKKNNVAFYNRGIVYYTIGDYKEAVRDFSTNLGQGPKMSKDYFVRAQTYQMANKHSEAIADYKLAFTKDTTMLEALYFSGISLGKLKMNSEALTYYDQYFYKIQNEELSGDFYAERGTLKLKLKKYSEARIDFDKALALAAGNAEALYGLGVLYTLENNIEKAIPEFEQAFKTKKISRDRVKEDTPVLLSTIAKDKRFKLLVKTIDKKSVEHFSYSALYDKDEIAPLTLLASPK